MDGKKELTVSELRRDLPEVLHRILLLGESFVVMKNGKRFAVLSPIASEQSDATMGGEGRKDLVAASDVLQQPVPT